MYAHVNADSCATSVPQPPPLTAATAAQRGSGLRGRVHSNNNNSSRSDIIVAEEMSVRGSHSGSPARAHSVAVATSTQEDSVYSTNHRANSNTNENNASLHEGSTTAENGAALLESGLQPGLWTTTLPLLVALPADATLLVAPFVSGSFGYGSDIILFLCVALIVVYSYHLIGLTCACSGASSWEEAAASLVSSSAASLTAVALIFSQWLSCVFNVEVMTVLFHALLTPGPWTTYWDFDTWTIVATLLVWCGGMLLPALLPHMPSIRLLAFMKLGLLTYAAVAVIIVSIRDHQRSPYVKPRAFHADTGWMACTAVVVLIPSLMAHYGAFDAYRAMPQPNAQKLTAAAGGSITILAIVHFLVGLVVYFYYGQSASLLAVIENTAATSNVIKAACIALIIESCISSVIFMHGVTLSTGYLIHRRHHATSYRQRLVIAATASILSAAAGIFILLYPLFYSFSGTLGGGVLVFLMPAFLAVRAMKLTQHRLSNVDRVLYGVFCFLGVIVFLLGLFAVALTIMFLIFTIAINHHPLD